MHDDASFGIEDLIAEAVRALAVLDHEALQSLLAGLLERQRESIAIPRSTAEQAPVNRGMWVLGHLLAATGQRLTMLRSLALEPVSSEGSSPQAHSIFAKATRAEMVYLAPEYARRRFCRDQPKTASSCNSKPSEVEARWAR
jgi:hypothetical protein